MNRDIEKVFAAVVDICNAKNLTDEAIQKLFSVVISTIVDLEREGFVKRDKYDDYSFESHGKIKGGLD